jgi:hypothetical protein
VPRAWRRRHLGIEADRATFRALHSASLASPALRSGLNRDSAERSIRHLHALLGTPAITLTDTAGLLAWHGAGQHHQEQAAPLAPGPRTGHPATTRTTGGNRGPTPRGQAGDAGPAAAACPRPAPRS